MMHRIGSLSLTIVATLILLSGSLVLGSSEGGALDELAKVKSFAFGGIGVAGTMSGGERNLRAVLQHHDASRELQAALGHASLEGQLYILVGLRRCDKSAYEKVAGSLPRSDAEVEVIGGCMIQKETFSAVLAQIDAGRYDEALSRAPW